MEISAGIFLGHYTLTDVTDEWNVDSESNQSFVVYYYFSNQNFYSAFYYFALLQAARNKMETLEKIV